MVSLRRVRSVFAYAVLFMLPSFAIAQSDAEIALSNAREAFAAENFEEARDLLITAAQTDARNPDSHLLLGKAHYQLGEVKEAMEAWRTSCPRLSIWEDAVDHGFIKRAIDEDSVPIVRVTAKGADFLKSTSRRQSRPRSRSAP